MVVGAISIAGDKLKDARIQKFLSQRELAKKVGVSGSLIGQLETGARNTSLKTLKQLAEVLDVDAEWLCTTDDEVQQSTEISPAQIDFGLFLHLLLTEGTSINKEKLADDFNLPPEKVEEYSDKWDVICKPGWIPYIPRLIHQLDVPAVCHKLEMMAAYLKQVEADTWKNQMVMLVCRIQAHVEKEYNTKLTHKLSYGLVPGPIPYFCCPLNDTNGVRWEFRYFASKDMQGRDIPSFTEDQLHNVNTAWKNVFVFGAEDTYTEFVKAASAYASKHYAGDSSEFLSTIHVMWIDETELSIQSEQVCRPIPG